MHATRGPSPCLGDGDEVTDKVAHPVRAQAGRRGGPALASLRVRENVPARFPEERQDRGVVFLGSRVSGDEERAASSRTARTRDGRDREATVDEGGGARAGQQATQLAGRGGDGDGDNVCCQRKRTERIYLLHAPNRRMNA